VPIRHTAPQFQTTQQRSNFWHALCNLDLVNPQGQPHAQKPELSRRDAGTLKGRRTLVLLQAGFDGDLQSVLEVLIAEIARTPTGLFDIHVLDYLEELFKINEASAPALQRVLDAIFDLESLPEALELLNGSN
jgi:hypothetical protein